MSKIPAGLKYTKSHEWVNKVSDNEIVIGVTDHAQQLLGDLVFVELPEVDQEFKKGGDLCVLESVKAAADVYAPVAGTVIEVNDVLIDAPDLINQDPYEEAWICKMTIDSASVLDSLMTAEDYKAFVDLEKH